MNIRLAQFDDITEIERLIERSVWGLASDDYSHEQIQGALQTAWGVDSQLIHDGTYFVVEKEKQLVACGGWSFRKTLYGSDSAAKREPETIDPKVSPAKIRAFFVDPNYARQGIGSLLMAQCETSAIKKGFHSLELLATLPGKRLYEKHGFIAGNSNNYSLENNLTIEFVPMYKALNI